MTAQQIEEYLSRYNVVEPFHIEELAKTTSGNTSYLVDTREKQYVLRTLVRQSIESAIDEYSIQILLDNAGISCPVYLKSIEGNIVETINGISVALSERISGDRQSNDTLSLARNMGATLALIHNVLSTVHIRFNEQQWFNPRNTKLQLERYEGPNKTFISAMTDRYSTTLRQNLPLAVTHGDFHTNNIFSNNDEVTAVFDFESAEYTVRILDIARLYLTYIKVTDLNPADVIAVIISGYNSEAEKQLTTTELSGMNNAFIYVALVSCVSIHNHGRPDSSAVYLDIAKELMQC